MTELPPGWEKCEIGEVLFPIELMGKNEAARDICYIDISSIDNITNRITDPKRLNLSDAPSRARQIVQTGDVLFSTVRPYLRKIARVPGHYDGEIASTGFAVLRGAEGINTGYLFFKAISYDFVSALTGEQYGVSYPAVKEEQVRAQALELPPTNEQRRIVEKIEALFDEIDKGVESLAAAKAALGLYRESLLKAAFEGRLTADWRAQNPDKLEDLQNLLARIREEREGWYKLKEQRWHDDVIAWGKEGAKGPKPQKPDAYKPGAELTEAERKTMPVLPDTWVFVRLSDISHVGSGMSVSKARKLEDPVVTPYLRVANVQRGHIDLSEVKTMAVERSQLPSLRLEKFDILFNEGGDRDKLGRGWIWEGQLKSCITQNHVFHATPFRHDKGWSQLISQWGNSYGRDYFEAGGKQTTNLASINKTVLKALPVPVCSPAEQAELVRVLDTRLEAADRLATEIDAALSRADALRQSVLKRAFSGKLVPQDPNDEPASALLARIQQERAATSKKGKRKVSV